MKKYIIPYCLLVLAIGAPVFLICYLWPIVTQLEYSTWLTVIGLVMLVHFERHLWPILRDQINRL